LRYGALLLLLVACKDAKDFTDRVPAQQRALKMQMSTWMPKDVDKAWQGAWLLQLEDDGPFVAVDVRGDKAMLFDGVAERQVDFKIIEPCAVAFGTHEIQFLLEDGKVRVGRGAAGMRSTEKGKEETAIACGDGRDPGAPEEGVFLVEGNRCASWKRDAKGAWSSREGVCTWANARGDDLLDVGTEHYSSTLVVRGAYMEERSFTKSSKANMRATSWDAAKTSAKGNVKPTTKADEARDAGGKVGDATTIAGIQATFANNPQPLVGLDLELTGVVVDVGARYVVIAEANNPKSLHLACETIADVTGVTSGDKVTVKGAIDTRRHDTARLRRCTVTKVP
jgi:hypothetical protein